MSHKTVSTISNLVDWPVSFPLQSIVELVSAWGLQPETIVSRLSVQLGGKLAHNVDNNEKIVVSLSNALEEMFRTIIANLIIEKKIIKKQSYISLPSTNW